jgi:quercetin dioxygenase-like cupin family protein
MNTQPTSDTQFAPGISLTPLLEQGLSEQPNHYAQILTVTLDPGITEPRHLHGGDEFLYLLDGEGAVEIDGAWTPLEVGKVAHVAMGRTKALRNTSGSIPLRVLAFLVLDGNKPSFQPVEC